MSYQAYLLTTIGLPRDHKAIFVETVPATGAGHRSHVYGAIAQGMSYQIEAIDKPESNPAFIKKDHIGAIKESNFEQVDVICRTVSPPEKQFECRKRLYPDKPLRRCGEWAAEAIQALKDQNILQS